MRRDDDKDDCEISLNSRVYIFCAMLVANVGFIYNARWQYVQFNFPRGMIVQGPADTLADSPLGARNHRMQSAQPWWFNWKFI